MPVNEVITFSTQKRRYRAGIEATDRLFAEIYFLKGRTKPIVLNFHPLLYHMARAVCFLAGSVQGSLTFSQEVW